MKLNKQEKIEMIRTTMQEALSEVLEAVLVGKIPDDWGTEELKWYMADKLKQEHSLEVDFKKLKKYSRDCKERGLL